MARASGVWVGRSSLTLLVVVASLLSMFPAWGQESPPGPTPQAGTAAASSPAPPVPPGQPPVAPLPGPTPVPSPIIPGAPYILQPGSAPGEVIAPARELRFAPFPELPAPFQLRTYFTVEQEYTDNANQTKNDRKGEFRTSIVPGIAGHMEGARTSLDLAYTPRVVIPEGCPSCSDSTAVDHDVTFRGWHDLTPRLRLSVGEDYTRSSDVRQFGTVGAQTTGGKPVNQNVATGEMAYTYGAVRTGLSYTNNLIRSDAATTENSTTHIGRGIIDLTRERYGLGGSYAATRAEFDISSPYWDHSVESHGYWLFTPTVRGTLSGFFTDHLADQSGQDFRLTGGRVGGATSVGPDGTLSAEAGPDVLIPEGKGARVFPAGKLTYTHRFPILAMALSYTEGVSEQFQTVGVNALTHSRTASLEATGLMFRDLIPTLAVSWNWLKGQQSTSTGLPVDQADQTVDIEARLQYFILRPLAATLSYILTLKTSNNPGVEYTENRVRLSLTYYYDFL